MKTPRLQKKVHKDCPFTREEILEIKSMLYNVNTSHHCCNPAPIHWGVAAQEYEQLQAMKGSKERYKEWLEEELRKINELAV
jgi:hypothetical protein